MYSHKKKMIVICSILVLLVIGVFAADAYFSSQESQGLFSFVSFAPSAVRIGDSEVVIDADGEVISATLLIRNIGGVISGGAPTVSSNDSTARYQITYTKDMKKPREEQASATASFSQAITLQDLESVSLELMDLFPKAELQLQFSPKSSQTATPRSYDGYYQYRFSDGLQSMTADDHWSGDTLTVKTGQQTYLVIFQNNPLGN